LTVVFWIAAALTVLAALTMVGVTNLVHSALALALSLLGIAVLFILLSADFLAAIQILIYVGAVVVLLVFGIMLIQRGDMKESNLPNRYVGVATLVVLVVVGLFSWLISTTDWQVSTAAPVPSTVEPIARLLFTRYIIPFEVAGLLLLAAVIGAIILAREVKSK